MADKRWQERRTCDVVRCSAAKSTSKCGFQKGTVYVHYHSIGGSGRQTDTVGENGSGGPRWKRTRRQLGDWGLGRAAKSKGIFKS